MTAEIVDKYFGIPMSDWIARVPNELEIDAVGLWQIFPVGIDSFGLSGECLADFGYRCVTALLQRGAVPVTSMLGVSDWVPAVDYRGSTEEIAWKIIDDWKAGKLTPDHDGLWFAICE